MSKDAFFSLLQKYVNNTISEDELSVLESFLDQKKYQLLATEFLYKDYHNISEGISFDARKGFQKLENRLGLNRKGKIVGMSYVYRYAAALIVLIGIGVFVKLQLDAPSEVIGGKNVVVDNEIRLITDDGNDIVLSPEKNDSIKNAQNQLLGTVNKGVLEYEANNAAGRVSYNTLKVPFGKRFAIRLADGSSVEMNAGSSLRYPTSFSNSSNREVYLEGEAYFDIAKNTEKPFIVNAAEIDIEVLGTRFNVSAYDDENGIKTTLEEGTVKVFHEKDTSVTAHILKPNQQAVWNAKDNSHEKYDVDVEEFLAWRNGILVFKKLPFAAIQKTLERHYNIQINNSNTTLQNRRFTARLEGKSVEQVMTYLNNIVAFEYEIKDREIMIK